MFERITPAQVVQPAGQQVSDPNGQVAPPSGAQAGVGTPGLFQQQQPNPQPGVQPQQNNGQQQSQPAAQAPSYDPSALERERQARLQAEQQANQFQQTLGQIQQFAQQQQQDSQLAERLQLIVARANAMPQEDANKFLVDSMRGVVGEVRMTEAQLRQQENQQAQMALRSVSAPVYAEHLGKELGMTPEAVEELKAIGDPDQMFRQAKTIKARYDGWAAERAQFQNGQVQNARTQEVQAMSNAGLGSFGGQTAGGDYQLNVSDDPDVAAMQILQHLRERESQGMGAYR